MIHNEFANEFGIELSYEKILSPIGDFALIANEFIKDGGLGFNITVPFKLDAFNFCEELTSNARAAGAVNTIKVQNKVIYGENTDGNGLVNDLENNLGESIGGKEILIIVLVVQPKEFLSLYLKKILKKYCLRIALLKNP